MDKPAVSRAYLSRKLTRPLPTKDGGTFGCRRIGSEAPGGKGQPNYSLRRPMSALSAGNSNSRCSMTASSTLGRWHENPNALHLPRRYLDTGPAQKQRRSYWRITESFLILPGCPLDAVRHD